MAVKQVICINWGTKYGPRFINRLYSMVRRNITPPYTFTCFTDNADGLAEGIRCFPLPEIDAAMPVGVKGKWPKSRLWGPKLGDLAGPVLFLDLDVVITGSLDDFFTFGKPDDVILSRNPAKPFERLGQTSVFRFPVGKLVPIQKLFATDPQGIAERYQFEQRFVTRHAPGGITFFPRRWVRHFRHDCVPMFPLNLLFAPRMRRDMRVVIFPGGFHPEHAIAGGWIGSPGVTAGEHLRRAFSGPEGFSGKRLRQFCKPSPWVEALWQE